MSNAYSHSRMNVFVNCPKRYWYQYIMGDVQDDTPHKERDIGVKVHNNIDKRLSEGKELTGSSKQYEPICKVIEDTPGYKKYYEKKIVLDEKHKPVTWGSADGYWRGIADVLMLPMDYEHPAIVIDWKTGKRNERYFNYDQLEMMACMVWDRYPRVNDIKIKYVWLKQAKIDVKRLNRRTHYELLWSKQYHKANKIEKAKKTGWWPARPSGLCPFCPAINCSERRG